MVLRRGIIGTLTLGGFMYTRVVSSKLYLVHMVYVEGKGYRQQVIYKFQKGDDVLTVYKKLQDQHSNLKWNLNHEDILKALENMKPSQKRQLQRKRKIERLINEASSIAQKLGTSLDEFFSLKNRVN